MVGIGDGECWSVVGVMRVMEASEDLTQYPGRSTCARKPSGTLTKVPSEIVGE